MLTAVQAVLAATVAAGYFVVAAFVVPRIHLEESTPRFSRAIRVGALVFFIGCGLTHTNLLVHHLDGTSKAEWHELAFHVMQVGGVWVFALAAMRILDVKIERRKTGEERLRERIDALARSNADLDEFAYVVSHDLQEPLRTMKGFAGVLAARGDDERDPIAREAIEYIQESSERMSRMLDGVLEYSRAAGTGLDRSEVDLDEVLSATLEALRGRIGETGATVDAGPLPTVWGDRVQLGQLLQNLVGNALKFGREGVPPEVVVTAEEDATGYVVSVRDNGTGIDPEQAARVFRIFERAHDDREGTGIGLAVCQKIAGRHGGRLWHEPRADGAPGSVFRFSLPQRVAEPGRGGGAAPPAAASSGPPR